MELFKGDWEDREDVEKLRRDLIRYAKLRRLKPHHWEDFAQWAMTHMWQHPNARRFQYLLVDYQRENFGRQGENGQPSAKFLALVLTVSYQSWHSPRSPTDPHVLRDARAVVTKAALEVLSPREHNIFELTMSGWNQHEIAESFGRHESWVSQQMREIIRVLRGHRAIIDMAKS